MSSGWCAAAPPALRPFGWGLTQLDLDTDLLALGKFAVRSPPASCPTARRSASPGDIDQPRPIDVPEAARNSHRLSAAADAPARRRGDGAARAGWRRSPASPRRARGDGHQRRLSGHRDGAGRPAAAALRAGGRGARRPRRDRPGPHRRGARRQERGARRRLHPAAAGQRSPPPSGRLRDPACRACCITAPRRWPAASRKARRAAPAEIADYLMLQLCNRYEPLMTHLAATLGQMHPGGLLPGRASAWPASWRRSPRRASGPRRSRRIGTTTCRRRSAR